MFVVYRERGRDRTCDGVLPHQCFHLLVTSAAWLYSPLMTTSMGLSSLVVCVVADAGLRFCTPLCPDACRG